MFTFKQLLKNKKYSEEKDLILKSHLSLLLLLFLGRVHTGMAVVKRMGMVETDKNDRPIDDVKILKAGINM